MRPLALALLLIPLALALPLVTTPALAQAPPGDSLLEHLNRPSSPYRARPPQGAPRAARAGEAAGVLPAWQQLPAELAGGAAAGPGARPAPGALSRERRPPAPGTEGLAGAAPATSDAGAGGRGPTGVVPSGQPRLSWLPGLPSPPGTVADPGSLPPEPRIALHDGPACVRAMADAISYLLVGHYQAGIVTAHAAAVACPEMEEAALLEALLELLGHRTREATVTLRGIYERGARAADALTWMGIWCLFLGDAHGARENLEEALAKDATAWRARLALATHLWVTGKRQVALRTADRLATEPAKLRSMPDLDLLDLRAPAMELLLAATRRVDPRCPTCLRTSADVAAYEAQRRQALPAFLWWQQAVELLSEVVEEHPGGLDDRLALARALGSTGAHQTKVEVLEAGLRRGPEPGLEYQLGLTLLDLEKPDQALPYLEQAAAREPDDPERWSMLGTAQRILGRPEAVTSLRKAIALDPGRAQDSNDLGQVLSSMGYHPEALDAYRRALAINPMLRQARYGLGVTLQALGRPEEAREQMKLYQQLLDILQERLTAQEKQSNLESAALEGLNHLAKDRIDPARASFGEVLKEVPLHPFANMGQAGVLLRQGRAGQAAPHLEKLLEASARVNSFIRSVAPAAAARAGGKQ